MVAAFGTNIHLARGTCRWQPTTHLWHGVCAGAAVTHLSQKEKLVSTFLRVFIARPLQLLEVHSFQLKPLSERRVTW